MGARVRQAFWGQVAGGDVARLFDLLPDVSFFAKDRHGRFVALNRLGCEFCGVATEADALGKTDRDFFGQRRAAEYARDDAAVIRSGRPIVNRIESAPEREGSPRLVMTTKVPLCDRAGRVVGIAGVTRRLEQVRERPGTVAPLARVIARMHARPDEDRSSREWARIAGMSLSHFDRVFRRMLQTSPRQYFLRVRVEAACRRLAESHDTIAVIALACGFHDHAHFTRSFRRIMGLTPSAYRVAHQSPRPAARRRR
ncbi:MAG: AraC family transcriptional regulator [Planctomycetia bacterium]|nr:AraC family transcriptional regulator [Planctomycetia bacterium]